VNQSNDYLLSNFAFTSNVRPYAKGNSNGSLDKYWECFRKEGAVQGGFIWDWVDQGLDAVAPSGRKFWAYGTD